MGVFLLATATLGCGERGVGPARTPDAREALFATVVASIQERDAGAAGAAGADFARRAESLRPVFREARTGVELLRALSRLSDLRNDGHLQVRTVLGGIRWPVVPPDHVPFTLAVDESDPGNRFLFVSGVRPEWGEAVVESDPPETMPGVGDRVVEFHGLPVDVFIPEMFRSVPAATPGRRWLEAAVLGPVRRIDGNPEWAGDYVSLALETPGGERRFYRVSRVPLSGPRPEADPLEFFWAQSPRPRRYAGFEPVLRTGALDLHAPVSREPLVLLAVHGFKSGWEEDLERVLDAAEGGPGLEVDVILDLTHARGGKRSWQLLRHLVRRPFFPCRSNLRVSSVTPRFVEDRLRRLEDTEEDRRLGAWLRNEVTAAVEEGRAWVDPVPFKLRPPVDAGGRLSPAARTFRGRLVALTGPRGRSQVDQLAAMIADNDLGRIVGMPTAGSSNAWLWRETLRWPGGEPIADFMWSLGQTLRPEGSVLEGNPAQPHVRIPVTRENAAGYADTLVARARKLLRKD